jgi:GNAT superfamily N-acetyltransferase
MYFNYSAHWPGNWWERRSFLHAWWKLYEGDKQWTPPSYTALAGLIRGAADPLYTRLVTQPLYLEAMPRRGSGNGNTPAPAVATTTVTAAMAFEDPVAATLVQIDRRRDDHAAYLGLLRCANDEETLERLLAKAFEHAAELGCGQLLGPTGVFPAWNPGALVNHFNQTPPWHTPYNPPYAGDLMAALMEPWLETELYELSVPATLPTAPTVAEIEPLALHRLEGDLLPLLAASTGLDAYFPAWDELEARTLLQWLQTTAPPQAWVAAVDGAPVGFVLVQADLAPLLQRTGGGRRWLGRGYLALRRNARVARGRVLLGTVAPQWQGRGVGRQLWRQALAHAQQMGWEKLTCGPLEAGSEGAAFLARQGARAQQRYVTYAWTPW